MQHPMKGEKFAVKATVDVALGFGVAEDPYPARSVQMQHLLLIAVESWSQVLLELFDYSNNPVAKHQAVEEGHC